MKPRRASRPVAAVSCLLLASIVAARAAVTMDGTTGAAGPIAPIGGGYAIPSTLGKTVGRNLFLSFDQFNLDTGESATFSGPNTIGNILARVTGGASTIDGTIISQIQGAHLFLINPQGITFNANAKLDLKGAFTASTADYVKLGTGGRFDARNPSNDVLTSDAVSAWGFMPDYAPAMPIAVLGSTLSSADGTSLSFIGGDMDFESAHFSSVGGSFQVAAFAKAGEYSADLTKVKGSGFIGMQDSDVTLSGTTGGGAIIRGGGLTLQRTKIVSQTQGSGIGGAFDVAITGQMKVTGGVDTPATITTSTTTSGQAGKVSIRAGKLVVDGDHSQIGSLALNATTSAARAGRVDVRANQLAITNRGRIESTTSGAGSSDVVTVHTFSLSIIGDASSTGTGIFSNSTLETADGLGGNAGGVRIQADSLRLRDGALIGSSVLGLGKGGNVVVSGKTIDIAAPHVKAGSGLVSDKAATGIFADTGSFNAPEQPSGKGGSVSVYADWLSITNGGLVSTKTVGLGHAGNTEVHAGRLDISRGTSGFYTGIAVDSPLDNSGPGGDARVVAGSISVLNGGQISANTKGTGKGGSVQIAAQDILLDGTGRTDVATGILAESDSTGKGGSGGSIILIADSLIIRKGARVSTSTFGTGKGGDIAVSVGTLDIAAIVPTQFTGIISSTVSPDHGAGASGRVVVQADTAKLTSNGGISATTLGAGAGGSVILSADSLFMDTLATIEASSTGLGNTATSGSTGGVTSSNSAPQRGLTVVPAPDTGAGNAGSVTINVIEPLILRGLSKIRTTAAVSSAGQIHITSASDIDLGGASSITVTATQGNAGLITLTAPGLIFLHDGAAVLAEAGLNGGNVSMTSRFGILDFSRISANAILGAGGNILIIGDSFLPSSSPVTASSQASVQGTVVIQSPDAQLANALTPLPEGLIGTNVRLSERCALRLGADFSSFLVVGRGGVSIVPDTQRP